MKACSVPEDGGTVILKCSCLILAGGKGVRLSPDKPLLEVGGEPIIARVARVARRVFDEVLLVTNTPEKYGFLGLESVCDERPGCGPLMGIATGLKRIRHEAAFACAADMPFLSEDILRAQFEEFDAFDIVLPCPQGLPEFLHAYYRKRCVPVMEKQLARGSFKIESIVDGLRVRRLGKEWFSARGLDRVAERAFVNINTPEDYRLWRTCAEDADAGQASPFNGPGEKDLLETLGADLVSSIRKCLVERETAYQRTLGDEHYASLWAHSLRVGQIARHLAQREGADPVSALLCGLLHDAGKFADGAYHRDGAAEEEGAAEAAALLLVGTVHEKRVKEIQKAVLSLYREDAEETQLGRILYDADRLDKMGCMGVAQFFAKNALRRRFLDNELLLRASVELTYAYCALEALKTGAGRRLAVERAARTKWFYGELLSEWAAFGLGRFAVRHESIEGIECVLVVPEACECGGRLEVHSDIRESVKCRSAVVQYRCPACRSDREFSFCLPNVRGLPRRRERQD